MLKMILAALVACSIGSTAATAQQRSFKLGPYWTINAVHVETGHFNEYMDLVMGEWRATREFAKSQGWELEYHVLTNDFPREGEPNIYLIARFADFPSTAELERRDKIIQEWRKRDPGAQERVKAPRSNMRRNGDAILLRELVPNG